MRCSNCNRPIAFEPRRLPGKKKLRPGVHASKGHDLCSRCFRDQGNRQREKGADREEQPECWDIINHVPPTRELVNAMRRYRDRYGGKRGS